MPNDNLPIRARSRLPGANTGPLRRRPVVPVATELIANHSEHLLKAELRRGLRRGEYGATSAIARTPAGQYAVKV
ncbi:MAG: hypothetical protein JF597_01340, partial [Streptomyces sp.]|uniref:hypothetical protein n=1 Tax=Streptomyces sp. TaxID=1931 RepID=UPI0025CF81B2